MKNYAVIKIICIKANIMQNNHVMIGDNHR